MDIQLAGELDGIETAREIQCIKETPVIFLTANNEKKTIKKAKNSFPAAFLSKPVRVGDFTANIEIALSNFKKTNGKSKINGDTKDNIYVPLKNGHQRVPKKEIYYIEASGSYVTIYTKKSNVVVSTNLGNIQKQLQCLQFVRISRKHVVNISHIDRIENNFIIINENPLIIGETYKNDFFEHIQIIKTK
jgi:DNA-binding LytR/AlgR family response regulator